MQIKINNYKIWLFIWYNIAILIIYNDFGRILLNFGQFITVMIFLHQVLFVDGLLFQPVFLQLTIQSSYANIQKPGCFGAIAMSMVQHTLDMQLFNR